MKKSFYQTLFLFCLCLIGLPALAQKTSVSPEYYTAAQIPDTLKKNANYVTRYYSQETTVKSLGKASIKYHFIKTLLNEHAESEAELILGYDKMTSVNSPEMLVYDANGILIKRYKKNDMYDHSAVDGMTLVTDDRLLLLRHTVVSYPVTVEVKFEYNFNNGYLNLADWIIQDTENSVQEAICKVTVNPEVGFRYKSKNTQISPVKTSEDGYDVYRWEVKNLGTIKPESGSKTWQVLPKITFATNNVLFGGIKADFSTWNGFGIWQQQLNEGLSSLPPARVEELKQMVSGLSTDKEKVKLLYEYMQKSVRYVGIQLGIGGWKPFPATFVDQKKYGDCKGLSNYMHALLKAVDIPSYYAVVRAGANEEAADPDFVSSPFNHIILCVPFKNDTTWLECTSNTAPFGKLGSFTENRNALLITDEGGKLVNTPKSKMQDHVFNSETAIEISSDGISQAKISIEVTGGYRSDFIGISYKKTDDQKKEIINTLNLKQADIFNLQEKDDKDGIRKLELNLEYQKLNDFSAGDKLFFRQGLFDLWKLTLPVNNSRKTDYFFNHPAVTQNKAIYKLPDNMIPESLPLNINLKFSHGTYKSEYEYNKDKNEIINTAKLELSNHIIPASKYVEMQKFMDDVAKSISKKLIIKKKS
jgi:transglutaminase-like putative cysteine protease